MRIIMETLHTGFAVGNPLLVARMAIYYPAMDRFLVTVRSDSGLIEFPGGKCDHGESLADGATRETREEVGLHVLPISPFASYETREMAACPGKEAYAGRVYKGSIALAQEVGRVARGTHCEPEEVAGMMHCTLDEIERMCGQEGVVRPDMSLMVRAVRRLLRAQFLVQS